MKKLFTLIELIVTIVVIGILAAIVIPNISSFKEESKETAIKSDGRNIQTAVDMYQLENYGKLPTIQQEGDSTKLELGNPKSLDFDMLYPTYIRDLPQHKGMFYWVDFQGKVYYSTIDNPTDFSREDSELTWTANEKANGYTIHELESSNTSASNKPALKLISHVEGVVNSFTPEGYSKEKTYLINSIDEYGNEAAPVKSGYEGIRPFQPEGIFPSTPEQEELFENPNNEMIATSQYHALIVKENGELWSFGYNEFGQLGYQSTSLSNPVPKMVMTGVKSVSASDHYSMVLKENGELWGFGRNFYGELGHSENLGTNNPNLPKEMIMDGVISVSTGGNHTVVVKKDGTLWTFGRNSSGELGHSENIGTANPNPEAKEVMSGAISVSAGSSHTLVVKRDGTLWSFGLNNYGQLGHEINMGVNKPTPEAKEIMSGVKSVSAGTFHTLVVKENGTLWSFGYNFYGQLGRSENNQTNNANHIATEIMSEVKSVSAGHYHSLVVKENSTLWSFGRNNYGQLGHSGSTPSPLAVEIMSGVKSVSGGASYSIVIKENEEALSFGRNMYGELGYSTYMGTANFTYIPKKIVFGN